VASAWAANLLPRWNFALNLLGGKVEGMNVPYEQLLEAAHASDVAGALGAFGGVVLGQPLDAETASLFEGYVGTGAIKDGATKRRVGEAVSLMLASPAFQWT
jgi:hypothetical protein